jgi:hypothetical protein
VFLAMYIALDILFLVKQDAGTLMLCRWFQYSVQKYRYPNSVLISKIVIRQSPP